MNHNNIVRRWWEQASERDQYAVLTALKGDVEQSGVPWCFLPPALQKVLMDRVVINKAVHPHLFEEQNTV